MMITTLNYLKNTGVFENYARTNNTSDFVKFNLIYGWNGSGKTTLTRVFESIAKQSLDSQFPSSDFSLKLGDGVMVDSTMLQSNPLNVHVFNDHFVKSNIDWDETVKSILLVAQEKITERKTLESKKREIEELSLKIRNLQTDKANLEKRTDTFLSDCARQIKQKFQILDTSDKHYFNYNKTKLQDFIMQNEKILIEKGGILPDGEVIMITKSARPNFKEPISLAPRPIDPQAMEKAYHRLSEILNTAVVTQVIQRLKDHPDIQTWVERGIEIHEMYKSEFCEFCGNILDKSVIDRLQCHFSKAFLQLKQSLERAQQWLLETRVELPELPPSEKFYDELQVKYTDGISNLRITAQHFNDVIDIWQQTLQRKIQNPFETSFTIQPIEDNIISDYNANWTIVDEIVKQHNLKSENFAQETQKAKQKLELHYSSFELANFEYFKVIRERDILNTQISQGEKTRDQLQVEISTLERELSNEVLGAQVFNDRLHKFLGRSDISLRFDKQLKGYKIIRTNSDEFARNLSEGEKTAIAFVYFVTKLEEGGNKLVDSILVIDDPVSSFDANYLFHAVAFLKKTCGTPEQLFVLTHNFTFYRLLRDWLKGKNKKNTISARFFYIDIGCEYPRTARLIDADSTLIDYESEYHFLFKRLNCFVNHSTLSVDEAFLCANLARRLLESFLAFKFPKKRNDFAQLIEECISDQVKGEAIYRFINKYSHALSVPMDDTSTENILGESTNVLKEIFDVMRYLDPTHYDEMLQVINS